MTTFPTSPGPRKPMTAERREAQRRRILAFVKGGMSYDFIASHEDLPRPRIREIILESVGRDPHALNIDSRVVNTTLLEPALRLAEQAIARGKLTGIDKLLKVTALMQKLRLGEDGLDEDVFEKLRRRHKIDNAPAPTKEKMKKGPNPPATH